MDRIIVGYDGSEEAERALARAAELAESLAAGLLVVSVVHAPRLAETVSVLELAEAPVPAVPAAPAGRCHYRCPRSRGPSRESSPNISSSGRA